MSPCLCFCTCRKGSELLRISEGIVMSIVVGAMIAGLEVSGDRVDRKGIGHGRGS